MAGAQVGERIRAQGLDDVEGAPDGMLNPKKNVFEKVTKLMATNDECIATYKGAPLMTSAGACFCACLASAKVS